ATAAAAATARAKQPAAIRSPRNSTRQENSSRGGRSTVEHCGHGSCCGEVQRAWRHTNGRAFSAGLEAPACRDAGADWYIEDVEETQVSLAFYPMSFLSCMPAARATSIRQPSGRGEIDRDYDRGRSSPRTV